MFITRTVLLAMYHYAELFFGTRRHEEPIYIVDLRVGDEAEEQTARFQNIALMHASEAGRLVTSHVVQAVVSLRVLHDRPDPRSVVDRVAGEVEDDRRAQSNSTASGATTLRIRAAAATYSERVSIGSTSREIHSSSQISTARSVSASYRASVVLPAPALPDKKCSVAIVRIPTTPIRAPDLDRFD